MSFHIVVDYVKTFGNIDFSFEHYVVTAHTLVDRYLVVPKMFLETINFVDPRSFGHINTCLL